MDPGLAAALAGFITTASTVLFMAGTYYFGQWRRDPRGPRHARRRDDSVDGDDAA